MFVLVYRINNFKQNKHLAFFLSLGIRQNMLLIRQVADRGHHPTDHDLVKPMVTWGSHWKKSPLNLHRRDPEVSKILPKVGGFFLREISGYSVVTCDILIHIDTY